MTTKVNKPPTVGIRVALVFVTVLGSGCDCGPSNPRNNARCGAEVFLATAGVAVVTVPIWIGPLLAFKAYQKADRALAAGPLPAVIQSNNVSVRSTNPLKLPFGVGFAAATAESAGLIHLSSRQNSFTAHLTVNADVGISRRLPDFPKDSRMLGMNAGKVLIAMPDRVSLALVDAQGRVSRIWSVKPFCDNNYVTLSQDGEYIGCWAGNTFHARHIDGESAGGEVISSRHGFVAVSNQGDVVVLEGSLKSSRPLNWDTIIVADALALIDARGGMILATTEKDAASDQAVFVLRRWQTGQVLARVAGPMSYRREIIVGENRVAFVGSQTVTVLATDVTNGDPTQAVIAVGKYHSIAVAAFDGSGRILLVASETQDATLVRFEPKPTPVSETLQLTPDRDADRPAP